MIRLERLQCVAALTVAVPVACRPDAPPVRVSVVPGSTVNALTLRVDPPTVSALRVSGSHLEGGRYAGSVGRTYWFIAASDGKAAAPLPRDLRFGEAPPGFTGTTPVALSPGAYEVDVAASGRHSLSYFRVANDLTVR